MFVVCGELVMIGWMGLWFSGREWRLFEAVGAVTLGLVTVMT